MSFLIGPGEGHRLGGRFDVTVRVRAEQTGGVMAALEETIPPGALHTFTVLGPAATFLAVSLTDAMGRFFADLDGAGDQRDGDSQSDSPR